MKGRIEMKRITAVILMVLLALSLVACNTDSLLEYKKAAEKTEQIKKGHTAGEFSMAMDLNTEGMTDEELKELSYYKDMKGSFDAIYDEDIQKVIFRNYLNLGGLGLDYDMFMNGDEMFMKLPVVGKYIKLNEINSNFISEQHEDLKTENIISKETIDGITKNWINLIKKEDVFKGKNIVLTTPDGEVKTTEYTIKLNDEQIKKLVLDSMDIVSKDEKLKVFYDGITKNIEPIADTTFEEQLSNIKESIDDYTVESFSYMAYVDIDGYIVNEMIELSLSVDNKDNGRLTGLNYKLGIKNWDINKDQSFEFPELTDDNTLKLDELDENNLNMIEDMFKNKN